MHVTRDVDVNLHEEVVYDGSPYVWKPFSYALRKAPPGRYGFRFSWMQETLWLRNTTLFVNELGNNPCVQCPADGGCLPCAASVIPGNSTLVAVMAADGFSCDWRCLPDFRREGDGC
eukprot:2700408-Rhodomonas_salina.1